MADSRLVKLAQVLVHYSLHIQPGDKFFIRSAFVAAPLVREVYREALQAGAHVATRFDMDELNEILLREGSDEQLTYVSDLDKLENISMNKYLGIWASSNTRASSTINPDRIALQSKAFASLGKE